MQYRPIGNVSVGVLMVMVMVMVMVMMLVMVMVMVMISMLVICFEFIIRSLFLPVVHPMQSKSR